MNTKTETLFHAIARRQTFRSLILAAPLLFALMISERSLLAQPQPQTMTKVVFRYLGSNVVPNSAEAQPLTVYRSGNKYERVEHLDSAGKMQRMEITSEPDAWAVNLVDRTAVHVLDKGPDFSVHHYVLSLPSGQPDPAFKDLEFGREAIFARQAQAKAIGVRKIENKEAKAFVAKGGDREATLYFDPVTDKPIRIDVAKDGKPDVSVEYLDYETNLPFDPQLFQVPAGIKITEAK